MGIFAIPVTVPGVGWAAVGTKPDEGEGPIGTGHSGTSQQVGSLGSGTILQPAGIVGNTAHLVGQI